MDTIAIALFGALIGLIVVLKVIRFNPARCRHCNAMAWTYQRRLVPGPDESIPLGIDRQDGYGYDCRKCGGRFRVIFDELNARSITLPD